MYNTEVLKSNLHNCNDAYILVRDDITSIGDNGIWSSFKHCGPFTKRTTKVYGTAMNDVEDLNLVIPIYNFLEHDSTYSDTTGSFWFCCKSEATNFNNDDANAMFLNPPSIKSK